MTQVNGMKPLLSIMSKSWRREYKGFRPHSSLEDLTPNEVHNEQEKSMENNQNQNNLVMYYCCNILIKLK
jgi:hypothetical protein